MLARLIQASREIDDSVLEGAVGEGATPSQSSPAKESPSDVSSTYSNDNVSVSSLTSRVTNTDEEQDTTAEELKGLTLMVSEPVFDFYVKLDFLQRGLLRYAEDNLKSPGEITATPILDIKFEVPKAKSRDLKAQQSLPTPVETPQRISETVQSTQGSYFEAPDSTMTSTPKTITPPSDRLTANLFPKPLSTSSERTKSFNDVTLYMKHPSPNEPGGRSTPSQSRPVSMANTSRTQTLTSSAPSRPVDSTESARRISLPHPLPASFRIRNPDPVENYPPQPKPRTESTSPPTVISPAPAPSQPKEPQIELYIDNSKLTLALPHSQCRTFEVSQLDQSVDRL